MALPSIDAKYYSYSDLYGKNPAGVVGLGESFLIECGEKLALISAVMAKLDHPPYMNPNLRAQLPYYFGNLNELSLQLERDNEQLDLLLNFLHSNLYNAKNAPWSCEVTACNYLTEKTDPLVKQLKELKIHLTQLIGIIRMHAR